MKKIRTYASVLALLLLIASCGSGESNKKLKIGYTNWADCIAITYLTKNVLVNQGYTVELLNADAAPIYTSIATKKLDLFLDMWLPVTHQDYLEQYGDKLEILGTVYDDARIGLVVPEYVTIQSIEELNAHKNQFNSDIIGIDAGSGIMKVTDQAIADYGLEYTLLTSSGPAMTASLKKAIDEEKWVVVTGWTPHWKFQRYKLKMLDDPKGVYGAAESIHSVAWKGFSEKDPFAAQLIKNIRLSTEEIGSLMAALEESKTSEDETVREWMKANASLVESWIPEKVEQVEE